MKRVKFLAIIALFSLSFVACTTEDSVATDEALEASAIDEAQASNLSDQVIGTVDEYVNAFDAAGFLKVSSAQKVSALDSGSVTITIDKPGINGGFPKKMSIDFGTGFTDKRGNILKGKIYILISARMNVAASYRQLEFSNFYINDNQLKGSKKVTFNGEVAGKISWSVSVKDTVIRKDTTSVVWNSERTRTRINNNDTPLIFSDDTYSITGTSTGINAKGLPFSQIIDETKPLILVPGWKYFVSGSVLITKEKGTALLDYGDGTKDAKATLVINGVSKDIVLKK